MRPIIQGRRMALAAAREKPPFSRKQVVCNNVVKCPTMPQAGAEDMS